MRLFQILEHSRMNPDEPPSSFREVTNDGGGDGGTLTLKDLDKQLLAHVAANTASPNQNLSIFNNQYKLVSTRSIYYSFFRWIRCVLILNFGGASFISYKIVSCARSIPSSLGPALWLILLNPKVPRIHILA